MLMRIISGLIYPTSGKVRIQGKELGIAAAIMEKPEILILDEPINGLDPIGIAEVRSFIRELCDTRGKTILSPVTFFRRFPAG